jgi:membrane peptidoglycan carboxypeptidase
MTFSPAGIGSHSTVSVASRSQEGRPRRHWVYRLGLAVTAGLTLLGVLLIALVATSPPVTSAPSRVATILAEHHAPTNGLAVPAKVGTALLATEDSRFYRDPALDPRGVARALWGVATSNGNDGGATIELQLAKMLYVNGTNPAAELRQVGVAFRLDQHYSKRQILSMYLDAAYFGDGAYGIASAAHHYFGLGPDGLSWAQASLLAGLVQAPSNYDPHGHLHLAKQRQSHVLDRLVSTGQLTEQQAKEAWQQPLHSVVTFYG